MKRLFVVVNPRPGEPGSDWSVVEKGTTYDMRILSGLDDEAAFPTGRSMAFFDPTRSRERFQESFEVPYDPRTWWTALDEDSARRRAAS
jgi:hypothetical protein